MRRYIKNSMSAWRYDSSETDPKKKIRQHIAIIAHF